MVKLREDDCIEPPKQFMGIPTKNKTKHGIFKYNKTKTMARRVYAWDINLKQHLKRIYIVN